MTKKRVGHKKLIPENLEAFFANPEEYIKNAEANRKKLREAERYATGEYMDSPPEKDYL